MDLEEQILYLLINDMLHLDLLKIESRHCGRVTKNFTTLIYRFKNFLIIQGVDFNRVGKVQSRLKFS